MHLFHSMQNKEEAAMMKIKILCTVWASSSAFMSASLFFYHAHVCDAVHILPLVSHYFTNRKKVVITSKERNILPQTQKKCRFQQVNMDINKAKCDVFRTEQDVKNPQSMRYKMYRKLLFVSMKTIQGTFTGQTQLNITDR